MKPIQDTLDERQQTHGSFEDNANVSQDIQNALTKSLGWRLLASDQREALQMIAHKIARIMSGNPNHIDHWRDIEGYAALVRQRLEKQPTKP